ncbi:MAG TPA: SRPBCC family protein [Iamia sp.]|nr:SRPBCC family protein [Iamia sp.]
MELSDTFTVSTPIDEMWPILCDIERIAPCMPGARLTDVEDGEYRGEVTVKVGPITARFKGTATMDERDDTAHRAVLRASGKDTGGKGNAHATITATAAPTADGGTEVTIATDLSITGKVAQFGRSAMGDISHKLLAQFVTCLESTVLATPEPAPAPAPEASEVAAAPTPPPAPTPPATEPEPIDLLDAAGAPVAKRLALPVAVVMAVFFALSWRRRRRRSR